MARVMDVIEIPVKLANPEELEAITEKLRTALNVAQKLEATLVRVRREAERIPEPGTIPPLPQSIFNTEKDR